jgi:diguanylate cyclase (GGDEF)-like protein
MNPSVDPRSVQDDLSALKNEVAKLRDENIKLRHEVVTLNAYLGEVESVADSDSLTPLPNRRRFLRELQRVIHYVARYESGAALLYVDVDDLEGINDNYGHHAGDAALIHVATKLRDALRSTDIVARIGGDEFGLLIDPIDEKDVPAKIESLRAAICATILVVEGVPVRGGVSVGYTMIRGDDDAASVLARADASMYVTKRAQRSAK